MTAAALHAGEHFALLRVPVDREEIFLPLALVRNRRIGMGMEEFAMETRFLGQLVLSLRKGVPDGML